ncbi:Pyruvate dehydrogenase E1 component [Mannheimia haemolytica]|uniref:Pyruvate dehydrogenase E1 component n=1 Tax=Mannheimia haemolytica TaxID=75985 RepID=A0A378N893_MANHA|nr:Pyruvate dehydrogenase E1 component [Mannheimia haemolytica]
MSENLRNDVDPIETQDWLASLDSLIREEGLERAQFIIEQVISQARAGGVALPTGVTTDYVNTIPVSEQPAYPGDHKIERRIRSAVRWNAIAAVLRSQKKDLDLGVIFQLSNLRQLCMKCVLTTFSKHQPKKMVCI